MVYRETDLVDDENRKKSSYYQKVYKPNNWHYSMQMILAKDKQFLGVITLYRAVGKENFAYDDIFLAETSGGPPVLPSGSGAEAPSGEREEMDRIPGGGAFSVDKAGRDVLRRIMEGKEREEICEELSISVNTLKKHTVIFTANSGWVIGYSSSRKFWSGSSAGDNPKGPEKLSEEMIAIAGEKSIFQAIKKLTDQQESNGALKERKLRCFFCFPNCFQGGMPDERDGYHYPAGKAGKGKTDYGSRKNWVESPFPV